MLSRLYRYVGPPDIADDLRGASPGHIVSSPEELHRALADIAPDVRGPVTVTFVVDELGALRVADRSSEHVACAGARSVMAAGELTFDDGEAIDASNQSTGFCPEPACWDALQRALDDAEIAHPSGWTASFEFRVCPECRGRCIVKDAVFECVCGGTLPRAWTFDRTRCRRVVVDGWAIDVVEEATYTDQDRVSVRRAGDAIVLSLADGAGGTSGGRDAAEAIVDARETLDSDLVGALRELDSCIEGRSTAVVAHLYGATVHGASVGDSEAWARVGEEWLELTADQRRKPLLGSRRAEPSPFGTELEALLIGSDGLFNYAKRSKLRRDFFHHDLSWRLADAARLPNGELWDDLSAIIVRRVDALEA